MLVEILVELKNQQVEKISHYRECFPLNAPKVFQTNIEILGLIIFMLNTVDPRQFDHPFQEVLRNSIQANANQVARRCRVMIDSEKHAKNPNFIVTLVKLLVQEIEADKNHYSVEISMYPMYVLLVFALLARSRLLACLTPLFF